MPKPKPHSGKWVSYLRVSTDRQGESGLGLEAQRKAVADYLNGGKWTLAAEFVEIESGKRSDNRPQLAAALAAVRSSGPSWWWPSSTDSPATWPSSQP